MNIGKEHELEKKEQKKWPRDWGRWRGRSEGCSRIERGRLRTRR